MRVNYVTLGQPFLPSIRHRIIIPGRIIGNAFMTQVPITSDLYIFSKPFTDDKQAIKSLMILAESVPYIFDCWDNLFCRGGLEEEYTKRMIDGAVEVVTAAEWLVDEIHKKTGRYPEFIQDPLEYKRQPIKPLDEIRALWFGSSSNLPLLRRLDIPYKLTIISDRRDFTDKVLNNLKFEYEYIEWSQQAQIEAMKTHNLLLIPGYDDPAINAKSANRVAEAINAGMSVVAYPIPAYKQFEKWITLSDNVNEACLNPKQVTEEAQDYVTDTFSPEVIGQQWKELFTRVYNDLQRTENSRRKLA